MKALTIITGIAFIILGCYAFATPFRVFLGMGWLLGILFAINGIQAVFNALKKEKKDWFGIVIGVIETIAGILILSNVASRFLTDIMVAFLVGFILILRGVFQVSAGYKIRKEGEKSPGTWMIVVGVLSAIVGFLAVGHPLLTMISVGYIIAFNIIMQGVGMIMAGFIAKKQPKYLTYILLVKI